VQFVPFADRNEQWWLQRLDEKANLEAKKQLSTILGYEFTKRFVDLFLNEFNIDGATMISNVSREQRKIIAKLL
jgi:predicted flavoprotein YhiN